MYRIMSTLDMWTSAYLPYFYQNSTGTWLCVCPSVQTQSCSNATGPETGAHFPAQLLQGMTKSQAKRTLENALRKWEKSILLGMLQVEYSQVRNGVETAIMNHQLETFTNIIKLGSNLWHFGTSCNASWHILAPSVDPDQALSCTKLSFAWKIAFTCFNRE